MQILLPRDGMYRRKEGGRGQDRGEKRRGLMRIGRSASYAWMRRALKGKQSGWLPGAATVIKHRAGDVYRRPKGEFTPVTSPRPDSRARAESRLLADVAKRRYTTRWGPSVCSLGRLTVIGCLYTNGQIPLATSGLIMATGRKPGEEDRSGR